MLITNYLGLAKLTAHLTFLTTTCNRDYKVCIKRGLFYDDCVDAFDDCRGTKVFIFPENDHDLETEIRKPIVEDTHNYTELEQITNRKRCKSYEFYDLKICSTLCPINGDGFLECNTICRQLLASKTGLWGLICPGDELCPNGCPCPHYECEQISDNSMLQVGWYSGHLTDYFDPAIIGGTGMNSWYELSELTVMRIDGSLLALYDYRTGNKTIFENVHFGRPYGVNSGSNAHNFGGFEIPQADYYDSYGNAVYWAPAEVDKNNVYVCQPEPATSVFYQGKDFYFYRLSVDSAVRNRDSVLSQS